MKGRPKTVTKWNERQEMGTSVGQDRKLIGRVEGGFSEAGVGALGDNGRFGGIWIWGGVWVQDE